MGIVEDFIQVNRNVFKKSKKSFLKNWPIVITGLVYSILNIVTLIMLSRILIGPLSIIEGFILGFISAATISNYLYLLSKIIFYGKINFQDFKDGFLAFLGPVYSVLVIAWIANYFLGVFGIISPIGAISIKTLAGFIIFIVLNALPEVLYQKDNIGLDSILYSFNFIKDNFIYWLIPNFIFYIIIYILTGKFITNIFTLGGFISFMNLNPLNLGFAFIAEIVFSFMMIYRGFLFQILSTSTRRKRAFMSKF